LSVHGFKMLFDSQGNSDTGFENCMLPGNINDRIVVFANKHEGFERHLFLKTGQNGGRKQPIESRKQKAETRGEAA